MRFCLLSLMYSQSAWKDTFKTASLWNTSCVGVASKVVCTVLLTARRTALRTPCHPNSSRSPESWMPVTRNILCTALCTRSTMPLACGLRVVITFRVIPYPSHLLKNNNTPRKNTLHTTSRARYRHQPVPWYYQPPISFSTPTIYWQSSSWRQVLHLNVPQFRLSSR